MTHVPQGVDPASLPGSTVFGDTPASTPETVSFVLRAQNLGQLENSVTGGVSHFLTVHQFASTYGQSPATVSALENYLNRFGIKTSAYANNLDVVANGTAGKFDNALAVQQHQYRVPAFPGHGGHTGVPAQTVHGTAQSPELPSSHCECCPGDPRAVELPVLCLQCRPRRPKGPDPHSSSSSQCVAETGLPKACNTPADFAKHYNLNGLYNRGALGQGQTVAIVTLAALDRGSAAVLLEERPCDEAESDAP